jgi:hypothetical protein
MKRFVSIPLLETILLFITMTGFVWVPDNRVPRLLWPLATGILLLLLYAFQQLRSHTLYEENLGALMGGTIFTVVGITLLFNKAAYLLGLGLGVGMAMLVGLIWTAWKVRKGHV